jgi:hypothetical protein
MSAPHSTMMLPELHLADWRATRDTLHLSTQIVGKIRLATTAPRNPYSREVISFGFWAGDDNVGDAASYSSTAPEPEGLRDQPPVGTPAQRRWIGLESSHSRPPTRASTR